MRLCYLDESFAGDLYTFVGVLVEAEAAAKLSTALDQLVRDTVVPLGLPARLELHGYDLFHGESQWESLKELPWIRSSLYLKAITLIVEADIMILRRSISKSRLRKRQEENAYPEKFSAETVCLEQMLQRVQRYAEAHDTYCLVIADERDNYKINREEFARYQEFGTPGPYMQTKLSRILDTMHFAPSHHSRLLQAADLICYLFQRRYYIPEEGHPKVEAFMSKMATLIRESDRVFDSGTWPYGPD